MNRRRNLLKLAGVTTLATPLWTKPVIETVLLPAHAQMSAPIIVVSSPSSLRVEAITGSPSGDLDGVGMYFDGDVLSLVAEDDIDVGNADNLIGFFDVDSSDPDAFDHEDGPGANWTFDSDNIPGSPYESDLAENSFTVTVTRVSGPYAGVTFDISFTIEVSAITGGNEMVFSDCFAEERI